MNCATRIIVSTIGVMLGIAGMNHGFFETLQGNNRTSGLIIQAIGEQHRYWLHGSEEAFTIVPNFLLTGILAMTVSILIMIWSIDFVHKKHGPTIFILLFVLLFLVGGGIGQIIFFIPTWLVSTRIHKPLSWWRRVMPEKARPVLAKLWPFTLAAVTLFFLIALEIAIFGFVPGVSDPDVILTVCWSFLGAAWVLMLFTFVAGFADDIEKSNKFAAK
jgi:hypothetical protein